MQKRDDAAAQVLAEDRNAGCQMKMMLIQRSIRLLTSSLTLAVMAYAGFLKMTERSGSRQILKMRMSS